MTELKETETAICLACENLKRMLINKNQKYGNSALEPLRIFSKASIDEQLLVRIDDKLSRIKNLGIAGDSEDTLNDLIGYLILLKINSGEK